MLRADPIQAGHLRHDHARRKQFRDDPPLVRVIPPSPATNATANLDAPSRRGSVNYMVDHICEPMPSTWFAFSELCRSLQDGGKTPLTHYLGHRLIASTVRYTKLAPDRFKGFWKD